MVFLAVLVPLGARTAFAYTVIHPGHVLTADDSMIANRPVVDTSLDVNSIARFEYVLPMDSNGNLIEGTLHNPASGPEAHVWGFHHAGSNGSAWSLARQEGTERDPSQNMSSTSRAYEFIKQNDMDKWLLSLGDMVHYSNGGVPTVGSTSRTDSDTGTNYDVVFIVGLDAEGRVVDYWTWDRSVVSPRWILRLGLGDNYINYEIPSAIPGGADGSRNYSTNVLSQYGDQTMSYWNTLRSNLMTNSSYANGDTDAVSGQRLDLRGTCEFTLESNRGYIRRFDVAGGAYIQHMCAGDLVYRGDEIVALPQIYSNGAVIETGGSELNQQDIQELTKPWGNGKNNSPLPEGTFDVDPELLERINEAKTAGEPGVFTITYSHEYIDDITGEPTVTQSEAKLVLANQVTVDADDVFFYVGSDETDPNWANPDDFVPSAIRDTLELKANPSGTDPEGTDIVFFTPDQAQVDAIRFAIEGKRPGVYPLDYQYNYDCTIEGEPVSGSDTVRSWVTIYGDPEVTSMPAYMHTSGAVLDAQSLLAHLSPEGKNHMGSSVDLSDFAVEHDSLVAFNVAKQAGETGLIRVTLVYAYEDPSGSKEVTVDALVTLFDDASATADPQIIRTGGASLTPDKLLEDANPRGTDPLKQPIAGPFVPNERELVALNVAKTAGERGRYPVTLNYVYEIPGEADPRIGVTTAWVTLVGDADASAQDFEAKEALTPEDALKLGAPTGTDPIGNPIPRDAFTPDSVELKAINDAIKAGKDVDLPLTFTTTVLDPTTGEEATVTATVTVQVRAPKTAPTTKRVLPLTGGGSSQVLPATGDPLVAVQTAALLGGGSVLAASTALTLRKRRR